VLEYLGMANVIELVRPETAFDPETVAVLAAAFNEAWDRLRASGSECARPAYARAMWPVVSSKWRSTALVSVREDIESDESVVIQEWRPDSGGAAADVDDGKSCPL
jgi:hypothetical protein